jgi:hypothetical protein
MTVRVGTTWLSMGNGHAMTISDYSAIGVLTVWRYGPGRCCICEANYNERAAMPDQRLHFPSERETILASILKSRLDLRRLQCDLHDTAWRSRETISQSLDLIAKIDEALAR